jgi:hypothetical protein
VIYYNKRFLIPAAVLIAAVAVVPAGIRFGVHSALAALGFPDAAGGSVSVGFHRTEIAGIRIGKDSEISIAIAYSASTLAHGRAKTITVSGAKLRGAVDLSGALALDGYAPSNAPSGGAVSLPADAVILQGVALALETPAGKTVLTASGTLLPTPDGLHLAGNATLAVGGIAGTAPIDFTLSPAGWKIALDPIRIVFPGGTDGANAVAGSLTLDKRQGAPATGGAQLDGQNLRLADIPVRMLSVGFKTDADGLSAILKLVPANGDAGIAGSVKSDSGGLAATLTAAVTEIAPIAKAMGRTAVTGPLKASLSLTAPPATGARPLTVEIAYDGAVPGGLSLNGGRLKVAGRYDGAANALILTSCGAFSADGVTLASFAFGKLSGCVGPVADRPLFSQSASGDTALAGALKDIAVSVLSGPKTLAEIKVPAAQAGFSLGDGGLNALDAQADAVSVSLPALGAAIQGLGGTLAIGGGDHALTGALSGRFSAAGPNSPVLAISGTLSGSQAAPIGTLSVGTILKAALNGNTARIDMPATEIGEGGADILQLMPGLATSASRLSGMLAFHADADWSGAAMTTKGSITAKDIAATTRNFTVDGLNTDVILPSLIPLTIAGKQKLTTKTVMVGVPLTDGEVVFSLNRNRILNLDSAHWTVAGGTVSTYDQQLDLYGPDQNLGVVIKDVDLAEILKLVNVNGLSAEGKLVGAIPLRHTKDTILVQHGYVQTQAEGVIRYDPADTPSFLQGQPGEGTAILRDALKDFHYQQLGIVIDGVLGGDQAIKMTLKGANPKLYGGLPVALNVNLSGALDSIARASIEAYTHPTETVRKKTSKKTGETK